MQRTTRTERVLLAYSGVLTIVVSVLLITAFGPSKKADFDEINVRRLNVVEPDGTLRLVISNKAEFPGLIVKGREYPHPRNTAGMLFFDDEGTENGGLIFGGSKDKAGKVTTWGHLSFDQYMQDQVFTIDAAEEDGQRSSQIKILDQPDYPITQVAEALQQVAKLPDDQRQAKLRQLLADKPQGHARLFLGKSRDKSVALRLKDVSGRDRLVIMVKPDGQPVLDFLDGNGKVIRELPDSK